MAPEVEQRLAAILAADVAGYTRLMADDEPATIATIGDYRAIFADHFETNGGRVVDMAGDSILAVFTSAAGAVKAAVAAQADVADRNHSLPETRRMRFRIGVNLGDIHEAKDGRVYGDGVNVAARLEGLAEPGGILISEDAYRQVRRLPEIAFVDAGSHEVKNVIDPVHAYRIDTGATEEQPTVTLALPDKPSIAVLAFDNLSRDPDQDYLADGISEDLITALSGIHWLFVTARNSAFTYKGRAVDVKQVGRELGVRYILEGSVRQAGKRIRVSAQLIDAASGNHLWAQRYDRELADIFDLQDEITATITAAIEPELGAAERERAVRRPPESLEAWGLYQRGLDHLYRFNAKDSDEAKKLFQAAAARDRRFAAPLGALAYALWLDCALSPTDAVQETADQAIVAGYDAVARDDKDPMAHFGVGRALTLSDKYDEAIQALETAVQLSPNFALAHLGLAQIFNMQGHHERAIEEAETAIRLSPQDPLLWAFEYQLALGQFGIGAFESAIEVAWRSCRHPNTTFWAHLILIAALISLNRTEAVREAIETLRRRIPDFALQRFADEWTPPPGQMGFAMALRRAAAESSSESKIHSN